MEKERYLMLKGWATLPTFKLKLEKALALIREALEIAPAYVSWSIGKDSTVLLHLVQSISPNIPAFYFTHLERDLIDNYSETEERYCKLMSTNLITMEVKGDHVPQKVIKSQLWQQYPVSFVGLRKEESKNRCRTLKQHGYIYKYKEKGWRICPLADWRENDIWAYIVLHNLPYLKSYDLGANRTTEHVSKSTKKQYQVTRLNEYKKIAPDYYQHLKENYPEMF